MCIAMGHPSLKDGRIARYIGLNGKVKRNVPANLSLTPGENISERSTPVYCRNPSFIGTLIP